MKIFLKVITKSSENKVVEDQSDLFGERFLKIKTTAIPENGAANKSIIEIISDYLKVSKSSIFIIKGHKTTNKIIEIK
jgi:uncharacterized protein YggU (UPF0235/DUF167 family)